MALPQWLARLNRRYTNPAVLKKGSWPVLVHVGRKSGTVYRTPLGVYPTADGFLFTVNYNQSDWPRNVVAAGTATLEAEGTTYELVDPRLVTTEVGYALLESDAKTPPSWVGVDECLVVKVASESRRASDGPSPSRNSS